MGSDHRCSFRSPVCVCVLWLAVPPWLTDFGGSAAFIMSGLGKVCPFVPVNLAQYHRVGDTGLGKVCLLCASGSGTVSWGWLNLGRICTSLPVNLAQYQWYGWGEVGGDVCWCGDRCCWGEFWIFVGKFARLYTRATGPETAETRPPQPFWGKPWSHTHLQFMLTWGTLINW